MSRECEVEIDSRFSCEVDFHYPKSIGQFDDTLEIFKARSKATKRKDDSNDSDDTSSSEDDDQIGVDGFGEKTTHD